MPSRSRLRPNVAGIGWYLVGDHAGMTTSAIGGKNEGPPRHKAALRESPSERKAHWH